jgi:hypothetical protein
MHAAPLDPQEIALVDGLPVTSLARTMVDIARTVPFEQSIVVADAALRGDELLRRRRAGTRPRFGFAVPAGDAGPAPVAVAADATDGFATRGVRDPVEPAALAAAVARAAGWPGVPAARRVIAFADGLSESVGESRSRVIIQRVGLPRPVLQGEIVGQDGELIGYADFGWPELGTVGEFDGRVKYGRQLRAGQDPGDVVFAEKLREDRLRDLGLSVVRWTWSDLSDFTPVADRLRRAFARAVPSRASLPHRTP